MEKRYNLEDWLELALDALAQKGQDVISVQRLCEHLGVSRGSFYWHFRNRDQFIEKLVSYWVEKLTISIVCVVEELPGGPEDRLLFLAQQIIDSDAARYDLPVRAWAKLNPIAAAAVKRADKIRYNLVRELIADIGFTGEELEVRSRMFVVYYSLEKALSVKENKKERLARVKTMHKLLIS